MLRILSIWLVVLRLDESKFSIEKEHQKDEQKKLRSGFMVISFYGDADDFYFLTLWIEGNGCSIDH